jgi:hypothetical protein
MTSKDSNVVLLAGGLTSLARMPPPTFAAYVAGRLRSPLDALGLALVYGLFLLVGGWVPLVATRVVIDAVITGLTRLPGCARLGRDPTASALSLGIPGVLLFIGLLRCDYVRLRAAHLG